MISVIGSLNIDLVTNVNNIPVIGETVIGNGFVKIPGGKGANQADAIAKLNGLVNMIGRVGNDEFGKLLIESLNKDGVQTNNIKTSDSATGTAIIMINHDGDNSIVVIPGANFELSENDIDEAINTIRQSNILLTQSEIPINTVGYSLEVAKKNGLYTILNPAPANVALNDFLYNVDLLTPNQTELEILSEIKINDDKDILEAANKLFDRGLKEMLVTLGARGAIYINQKLHKHFSGYNVKVVDTTAAGDSVNAALAVAIDEGKTIDDAINFAMKVGALTVTKKGAQSSLPTLDMVNSYFK